MNLFKFLSCRYQNWLSTLHNKLVGKAAGNVFMWWVYFLNFANFKRFLTADFFWLKEKDLEDICIVERLFSSSLIAVVSMANPRKLRVYHFKKGTEICNYCYSNTVLSVRLNRNVKYFCFFCFNRGEGKYFVKKTRGKTFF